MATDVPANRYTSMSDDAAMRLWHKTFQMFDRDGGGDVDLRELGLMFRQLGQAPSEKQMLLLIEEVDADGSGTVDFEEFCCLMLRQDRANRVPLWMSELLPADAADYGIDPQTLPTHALLMDPKFEAARRIQKRLKVGKGAQSATTAPPPTALSEMPLGQQSIDELSRDQLLMVVDLLPSAAHIHSAHVSGHGGKFGPFVAAELAWRLATSTRTTLALLDLSFNDMGDDGATAIARMMRQNIKLNAIDLSGNRIGARGAAALMASLCMTQVHGTWSATWYMVHGAWYMVHGQP